MGVSKRARYEVLRRDNFTCRYCRSTEDELTVDHVTPVALGGTDDPNNLVACCRDCNAGKSSTAPDATQVADVRQDALRWSAAMKLAADHLSARDEPMQTYEADLVAALEAYDIDPDAEYPPFGIPDDWRLTAGQFFRAGLPIDRLERALNLAMSNRSVPAHAVWRYMCGIGWNMVRDMQDEARGIMENEGRP